MKIYLVGGAVRDQLLGRPILERDWVVVGATPQQMELGGFRIKEQGFPVYLHPETKEEYALARREKKNGVGYKGFEFDVATNISLEEDLRRRDLTINAIAQAQNGEIIDPYKGISDLQSRRLRHITSAFAEDPLRAVRLARFQAELGAFHFTIDEHTESMATQICASGELRTLSAGRIWREVARSLAASTPMPFFHSLNRWGALDQLVPWLRATDVAFADAISVLTRASAACEDAHIRLAALLVSVAFKRGSVVDISEDWPIPAAARTLAQLCVNYPLPPMDDAKTILKWLESVDAWRRADRFANLLQIWLAVRPDLIEHINRLRHCCDISRKVPAPATGSDPRTSVRAYRLARITQTRQ